MINLFTLQEKLASVYQELGSEDLEPLPFKVLVEHPLIQDVMAACQTFKALVNTLHCDLLL